MRNLITIRAAAVLSALATAPLAFAQSAATNDAEISALREQIRALDQKLRVLERNQELKDETAVAAAKKVPAVAVNSRGLAITSPDKTYALKIGALVQADARIYAEGAADDTFLLRRVRLPVNGTAGIFNFNITPEFAQADGASGGNTQLVDAWVETGLSAALKLKAGKFAGPVSLETPNNRHFVEAAYPNQLATNRDIGFEIFGALVDETISYRLGVYNGAANNSWSGTTNLGDGDFTLGGRLTVRPWARSDGALSTLAFGVGGSIGSESGVSSSIRSNGQQTVVSGFSIKGRHERLNTSLEWYAGPFSLAGEYAIDRQILQATGDTVTNQGWRASAGYVLTGENATRRGVVPSVPFTLSGEGWGAFEVVARVSGLDVDDALFDSGILSHNTSVGRATSYAAGVNWYFNENVQLRLDAEKTQFEGIGTSPSAVLADDEFTVFTRVQLSF